MRHLSGAEVETLLTFDDLLPAVESAFVKQGRGAVERPERPHFPVGTGLAPDGAEARAADDPTGTGLVMPAYLHGADYYATKLVGVHEANEGRELPTVNADLVLTDARTGVPEAVMTATALTNARTGCIGGLAARELAAAAPVDLGVVGAGTQARWQARAIAATTGVDSVRVYSPSDSRERCAADLRERGLAAEAVDSPEAAVSGADVVVTATTATEPVFPGSALSPGALVVAVGAYTADMRELDDETISRASQVFADVPGEAVETGDLAGQGVEPTPLSAVFEGQARREGPEAVVVVKSVGSAVLDAAAGELIYEKAAADGVGTDLER